MLSKKPGPPVPPRPINTGAAHSLTKSQSTSTIKMPTPHERTVIYKSPSYDLKSKHVQEEDEENAKKNYSNVNHDLLHKVTSSLPQPSLLLSSDNTSEKPEHSHLLMEDRRSSISCTNNSNIIPNLLAFNNMKCNNNKTEIIILNSDLMNSNHTNNCKNSLNVILNKNDKPQNSFDCTCNGVQDANNSRKLEIRENSSVAKLRPNAPIKKQQPKINNENLYLIESRPNNVIGGGDIENNQQEKSLSITTVIETTYDSTLRDHQQNDTNRIEIKNSNLESKKMFKNANSFSTIAEQLFTEIVINSHLTAEQKQYKTTKLEHCIPVRTPSPPTATNRLVVPLTAAVDKETSVVEKITKLPFPISAGGGDSTSNNDISNTNDDDKDYIDKKNISFAEKKVTFHELLISELAEMHKDDSVVATPKINRSRRYSSSCSTDSSPNGTHRSRIRTSDWVEVGDNGKEVLLTSCQISLEDSGLEDEERLDDMSSGVGDSWDSVKDNDDQ